MTEIDDDEVLEYTEVGFRPDAILTIEQSLAEEMAIRVRREPWGKDYFNSRDERKFAITFALGHQLEYRIAVGLVLNIVIRGTNILPGGKVSITNKEFQKSLFELLRKFHRSLLSSDLVPERVLRTWNEQNKKLRKETFHNYEIPDELLFMVDKHDVECLKFETITRLVYKDRITKAIVEVEGRNEDDRLIEQRARAKLYTLRQLREI